MKIHIKGTNTTLTPAIEEYVNKKLEALEKLINKDDTSAHAQVEVGKESDHHKTGDIFFSEFTVHIAGKDFRARYNASDLYAAIDRVKDELMHAMRSHRGKKETLLRKGSLAIKNILKGFNRER